METIAEKVLAQSSKEIKDGFREVVLSHFNGNDNVTVRIYNPTYEDELLIAERYSEAFNKYLKEGKLLTRAKMLEKLEEQGVWTKDDEQKAENLQLEFQAIQINCFKLKEIKKPIKKIEDQIAQFDKEYLKVRNKWFEMILQRENYLDNTIEKKAEYAANLLKTYLCCKINTENGWQRLWNKEEDLTQSTNKSDTDPVLREAMSFFNGVSQEVLMLLPGDYIREQSPKVSKTDQVAEDVQSID